MEIKKGVTTIKDSNSNRINAIINPLYSFKCNYIAVKPPSTMNSAPVE